MCVHDADIYDGDLAPVLLPAGLHGGSVVAVFVHDPGLPYAIQERLEKSWSPVDLLVGPISRSAIGTLVDRTSRCQRLVHLPTGHRAEQLTGRCCPFWTRCQHTCAEP